VDGRTNEAGVVAGIADGGGFSSEASYRTIAVFNAKRGERYRLDGETSLDANALAFAQPRIVVQPTGMTNENEIVTTLAYWLAAGLSGVIGVSLLGRDIWRLRRDAV
jgi:hypothetical protein